VDGAFNQEVIQEELMVSAELERNDGRTMVRTKSGWRDHEQWGNEQECFQGAEDRFLREAFATRAAVRRSASARTGQLLAESGVASVNREPEECLFRRAVFIL